MCYFSPILFLIASNKDDDLFNIVINRTNLAYIHSIPIIESKSTNMMVKLAESVLVNRVNSRPTLFPNYKINHDSGEYP